MTGLLELPAELIIHVFSYLDNDDVFNARLANKYIESSSLSYFGRRFFRKKGYLITTPSINVLKSIANHNELKKYVQHVWFNPDCYTFVDPKCAPDEDTGAEGGPVERLDLLSQVEREQWKAFNECTVDHALLLSRPKLAEELTDVFSNLPNLAAIGMRRSEDHSPWGWMKLKEVIGEDPRVLGPIASGPKLTLQGPTKLFIAIINAVAAANVDLKRLYTDVVEIDNILPDVLPQETLNRACRSLQYLEFNATKAWLNKNPKANYTTLPHESEWGEGLIKLLKAVPHLLELGLQIFPDLRQSHLLPPVSRNPETWRKAYPYIVFDKITKHAPLQNLTRLKLEKLTTSPDILQAFLEPPKANLTSLKIRDVRLLQGKDGKEPWYQVFCFLRDSCPKLSYLMLYHLMYDGGGISFVLVPPAPNTSTGTTYGSLGYNYGEPGREQFFTEYEYITLEADGRDVVVERLGSVAENHWYHKPIFSYEMDEEMWHTDTSDEDW